MHRNVHSDAEWTVLFATWELRNVCGFGDLRFAVAYSETVGVRGLRAAKPAEEQNPRTDDRAHPDWVRLGHRRGWDLRVVG